jgi:hypothetical protein
MSSYASPESLVETSWLAEHLDDPTIRIVESNEDILLYGTGHIPNAVHIDWRADLNDPVQRDYIAPEATAYLEYLWSEDGQKLAARSYFRPRSAKLLAENRALFPPIKLVSVDDVFGGWDAAQEAHFADGGYFDKIYQAK